MTQISKQIDGIIYGLKKQDELGSVRFVREYGTAHFETPINGFVAVVGIKSTEQSQSYIGGYISPSVKGEMFSAKVEIRVYAPYEENGDGLTELVSNMLTGLKKADEQRIISDASASSIEFDPDLNAIFRRLEFDVDFCLCEEGSA